MRYVKIAVIAIGLASAGIARADITVTKARIGCLDIQQDGNLTAMVGNACNHRTSCTFPAPTEDEYRRAGVHAATRTFCTQAMEIVYTCGANDFHTVMVPGDAWKHPPAVLSCQAPPAPTTPPAPDRITVSHARIGCLDIQHDGNLTGMVGSACNGQESCSFQAPTPEAYQRAGVHAATRTFCTQAMEVTYQCGHDDFQTILVPGDAWAQPPAQLTCNPLPVRAGHVFPPGAAAIKIEKARIGCLDIQKDGNLTRIVQQVCDDRAHCSYKAPTQEAYQRAGVRAATRPLCTQAMEITYRCGSNDDQVVTVPGDAWNQPPAVLRCDGGSIATNRQDVTPPPDAHCSAPSLAAPDYLAAPANLLDWSTNAGYSDLVAGFRPAAQATRAQYDAPATSGITGAPGSTLGANEGRVRRELRDVAKRRDAAEALCLAAHRFTTNRPAAGGEPSDAQWGNAFADLAVTGRHAFASFVALHPTDDSLQHHRACAGATPAAIARALDRAYQVANALRGPHRAPARQGLGWIAVSGEDDQPYLPVNVPSTPAPQFLIRVDVPRPRIAIDTRYAIAHARNAPAFARPAAALVDGGTRKVLADPAPALAPDAQVILFVHGMDSRVEEADDLAAALAALHDKNWTVITVDLPTSGYGENIDHTRISPVSAVNCHVTPLVDFIEDYIVAFVDKLDGDLRGQLKPKLRAIVGGSLGGNMAMRLGRRTGVPWLAATVAWSPAAIWPSYVGQHNAVAAGCDTSWDPFHDKAVNQSLGWAGGDGQFATAPGAEEPASRRRELFYGAFDWSPVGGLGGPPQAQCWYSDKYSCKQTMIRAARLDRQETYDANYRMWHWRLGAEQLVFSQQQFAPGTQTPLYLRNDKRMLLLSGYEDTCADLGKWTREVAGKMVNTPGYARFLKATGHSLDNEHPAYVAKQIAEFLR